MPYIIVRHRVEDYENWRAQFDRTDRGRRTAGCQGTHLFRDLSNTNEVVILFELDSVENAMTFAESGALAESLPREPDSSLRDIQFLEVLGPSDA